MGSVFYLSRTSRWRQDKREQEEAAAAAAATAGLDQPPLAKRKHKHTKYMNV